MCARDAEIREEQPSLETAKLQRRAELPRSPGHDNAGREACCRFYPWPRRGTRQVSTRGRWRGVCSGCRQESTRWMREVIGVDARESRH